MIRLADLLAATGGTVHGPIFAETFTDFCYDTRVLKPGELFLAVVADTGDGHDYVLDAARQGAAGLSQVGSPYILDRVRISALVRPAS